MSLDGFNEIIANSRGLDLGMFSFVSHRSSSFIDVHRDSTQYLALPLQWTNKMGVASDPVALKPNLHQLLRSRKLRVITASFLIAVAFLHMYYTKGRFAAVIYYSSGPPIQQNETRLDWSRFAYTKYATNTVYLCNSVMIFESLKRFGNKAD